MKENKNTKCDPCERDFEHKIKELVNEGKSPSHEQRMRRDHEVRSAFGERHPAAHPEAHHPEAHPVGHVEMRHAAAKSADKHPVGAGAAKMKK